MRDRFENPGISGRVALEICAEGTAKNIAGAARGKLERLPRDEFQPYPRELKSNVHALRRYDLRHRETVLPRKNLTEQLQSLTVNQTVAH